MRTLIRELAGTLEDVVGIEDASGYISVVGGAIGGEIDAAYRNALNVSKLSRSQVAAVLVDLICDQEGRIKYRACSWQVTPPAACSLRSSRGPKVPARRSRSIRTFWTKTADLALSGSLPLTRRKGRCHTSASACGATHVAFGFLMGSSSGKFAGDQRIKPVAQGARFLVGITALPA